MADQLQKFEGETVVGSKVDLLSRADAIEGTYHLGDEMVLLVKGRVLKVGHERQNNGLLRVHKIKLDTVEHVVGPEGEDFMGRLREREEAERIAAEKAAGIERLALEGEGGPPDDVED